MHEVVVKNNLLQFKKLFKEAKFLSLLDPLLHDFINIQLKSEYKNNSKIKDIKLINKEFYRSVYFHQILVKINSVILGKSQPTKEIQDLIVNMLNLTYGQAYTTFVNNKFITVTKQNMRFNFSMNKKVPIPEYFRNNIINNQLKIDLVNSNEFLFKYYRNLI